MSWIVEKIEEWLEARDEAPMLVARFLADRGIDCDTALGGLCPRVIVKLGRTTFGHIEFRGLQATYHYSQYFSEVYDLHDPSSLDKLLNKIS
jgi:hypothetical protein